MIGIVYLGNNPTTQTRLKYIPSHTVCLTSSYRETASVCSTKVPDEHFIVFYERTVKNEDITAITYLRKKCPSVYIILITGQLTDEDRKMYLGCGVNDTLDANAGVADFNKKISFISDREDILFQTQTLQNRILKFKIPLWKRIFDIVFSLGAIVVLSPILLATIIAIKLESKGPVLFKSKRVGTNYKVFDFLKFRSMYTDAEKRLKDVAKGKNQYAKDETEEDRLNTHTVALGDDAEQNAAQDSDAMAAAMFISDDEVMLIGDDFVIAEDSFNKKKEEDIENTFVKIDNDPRVTKVGRFIRKYSIDELPQLFNILKGDMSVVGNRPLPVYEAEKLTADEYIDRFMAPAGLTGLWQVEKRGGAGKMSAEERKQLDITYGRTYNFALDMKIIFRTFTAFVQKENV